MSKMTPEELLSLPREEIGKLETFEYVSGGVGCIGCTHCFDCEYCSDCSVCFDCRSCYRCKDCHLCVICIDCVECSNCRSCKNCFNCSHCIGITGGNGKMHVAWGVQLTEEQWEKLKAILEGDHEQKAEEAQAQKAE